MSNIKDMCLSIVKEHYCNKSPYDQLCLSKSLYNTIIKNETMTRVLNEYQLEQDNLELLKLFLNVSKYISLENIDLVTFDSSTSDLTAIFIDKENDITLTITKKKNERKN